MAGFEKALEAAPQRLMKYTIRYLGEQLALRVNREKTMFAPINKVAFLGFRVARGKITISSESLTRFKGWVRGMIHRDNSRSMEKIIEELNRYLRGWGSYFRVAYLGQERAARPKATLCRRSENRAED